MGARRSQLLRQRTGCPRGAAHGGGLQGDGPSPGATLRGAPTAPQKLRATPTGDGRREIDPRLAPDGGA
jgi:hypothetical protein